jgi:hypothetical protein
MAVILLAGSSMTSCKDCINNPIGGLVTSQLSIYV